MYIGAITEKRFEYRGFPCVVIMQALCFRTGYVGVPKGRALNLDDIDCHGGITYSRHSLIGQEDTDRWWIGFDTGHAFDGYDVEGAKKLFKDYPETLKEIEKTIEFACALINQYPAATLEYCEEQCRSIVDQVIEKGVVI